jgi:hypothetical protein
MDNDWLSGLQRYLEFSFWSLSIWERQLVLTFSIAKMFLFMFNIGSVGTNGISRNQILLFAARYAHLFVITAKIV